MKARAKSAVAKKQVAPERRAIPCNPIPAALSEDGLTAEAVAQLQADLAWQTNVTDRLNNLLRAVQHLMVTTKQLVDLLQTVRPPPPAPLK